MNIEQIAQEVAEELVKSWQQSDKMPPLAWDFRGFAIDGIRRCLSKLAEQIGDAPVATVVISTMGMFAGIKRNLVLHQDAPILFDGDKLYTETQLLAAQQRTAEACAKVCEGGRSEDGDGQHPAWYAGFDMCIDAIRNGEWREYL